MLSAKTRTTILALVASASFAVATVAPAVSQARPKNVATKMVSPREACDALVGSIQREEGAAKRFEKAGQTKNAEAAWTAANLYFDLWSEQGCATMAAVGPSTIAPGTGAITPSHGVQAVVQPHK